MGKRKKKVIEQIGPSELDGWKLGDIVWGIHSNGDVKRGTIDALYDIIEEQPKLVRIICIEDSKYIILEMSTLEEESTKSKMKKKSKELRGIE
jgi:hypothetical protein